MPIFNISYPITLTTLEHLEELLRRDRAVAVDVVDGEHVPQILHRLRRVDPFGVELHSTNSFMSMNPSASASTPTIIDRSSSSIAGWPSIPMIALSSDEEILSSPFTSNFLKTCSSSAIYAHVANDGEHITRGAAVEEGVDFLFVKSRTHGSATK